MYVCGGGRADELLREGRSSKVSNKQKLFDSSWLSLSVNGKYPIFLIKKEQNVLSSAFIREIVSVLFLGNLSIHQYRWVLLLCLPGCKCSRLWGLRLAVSKTDKALVWSFFYSSEGWQYKNTSVMKKRIWGYDREGEGRGCEATLDCVDLSGIGISWCKAHLHVATLTRLRNTKASGAGVYIGSEGEGWAMRSDLKKTNVVTLHPNCCSVSQATCSPEPRIHFFLPHSTPSELPDSAAFCLCFPLRFTFSVFCFTIPLSIHFALQFPKGEELSILVIVYALPIRSDPIRQSFR